MLSFSNTPARLRALLALFTLAAGATGCAEEGDLCAEGQVRGPDGSCVTADFDAGGADAQVDGSDGGEVDAGPCGGCPDGEVCDGETCVACLMDAHCESGEYCDTATNECMVGCRDDSGCPSTTPTCQDHECVEGCTPTLCETHHADAPVCDDRTGRCGACSPATEAVDCAGGVACHPDDLECSGETVGSLRFCMPCVSDSECRFSGSETYRCVDTTFGTDDPPTAVGSFCLLDLTEYRSAIGDSGADCPDLMVESASATSVLGEAGTYCFPRESVTTCSAIRDLDVPCTSPDECGEPGLDDSVCVSDSCSYRCASPRDCSSGVCEGLPSRYCE